MILVDHKQVSSSLIMFHQASSSVTSIITELTIQVVKSLSQLKNIKLFQKKPKTLVQNLSVYKKLKRKCKFEVFFHFISVRNVTGSVNSKCTKKLLLTLAKTYSQLASVDYIVVKSHKLC